MSLTLSAVSKSTETVPAGTCAARCYQIVDLGHQTTSFEGEVKVVPQVRITWELAELMEDGRPFSISREYTASFGPKANLRKMLEAWRGRPFTQEELNSFSLENVLSAPCMLSVIHKPSKDGTKMYANVGSVVALPKGMVCPELFNPAVKFDISEFDEAVFNSFPDWLRAKILLSKEMEGDIPTSKKEENEPSDESVPF
jgi:hypothetical protein